MSGIRSELIEQLRGPGCAIPEDQEDALAPSVLCLKEWKDYWLEIPAQTT